MEMSSIVANASIETVKIPTEKATQVPAESFAGFIEMLAVKPNEKALDTGKKPSDEVVATVAEMALMEVSTANISADEVINTNPYNTISQTEISFEAKVHITSDEQKNVNDTKSFKAFEQLTQDTLITLKPQEIPKKPVSQVQEIHTFSESNTKQEVSLNMDEDVKKTSGYVKNGEKAKALDIDNLQLTTSAENTFVIPRAIQIDIEPKIQTENYIRGATQETAVNFAHQPLMGENVKSQAYYPKTEAIFNQFAEVDTVKPNVGEVEGLDNHFAPQSLMGENVKSQAYYPKTEASEAKFNQFAEVDTVKPNVGEVESLGNHFTPQSLMDENVKAQAYYPKTEASEATFNQFAEVDAVKPNVGEVESLDNHFVPQPLMGENVKPQAYYPKTEETEVKLNQFAEVDIVKPDVGEVESLDNHFVPQPLMGENVKPQAYYPKTEASEAIFNQFAEVDTVKPDVGEVESLDNHFAPQPLMGENVKTQAYYPKTEASEVRFNQFAEVDTVKPDVGEVESLDNHFAPQPLMGENVKPQAYYPKIEASEVSFSQFAEVDTVKPDVGEVKNPSFQNLVGNSESQTFASIGDQRNFFEAVSEIKRLLSLSSDNTEAADPDTIQAEVLRGSFSSNFSVGLIEETIDSQSVMTQTEAGIKSAISLGKSEYVIKLNPEGLGEITIKLIENESGEILVSLTAQSEKTAAFLQNGLVSLQTQLAPMNAQIETIQTENEQEKSYQDGRHAPEQEEQHNEKHSKNHQQFTWDDENQADKGGFDNVGHQH